jgi:hypothetical protein
VFRRASLCFGKTSTETSGGFVTSRRWPIQRAPRGDDPQLRTWKDLCFLTVGLEFVSLSLFSFSLYSTVCTAVRTERL